MIQRFPEKAAVFLCQQIFLIIPTYLLLNIKVLATYHVSLFPQLFSVNATNLVNNLQFKVIPCIQRLIFGKIYGWHLFCVIGIQRSASRQFQSLTAQPGTHKILQVRAPHMLLVWHQGVNISARKSRQSMWLSIVSLGFAYKV